jgi:L-seryl-tRNA(Ser) seleniumtransferase
MVGGGSLPGGTLPTRLVAISSSGKKGNAFVLKLSQDLRNYRMPIIGRISDNVLLLNPRSVIPEDDRIIIQALHEITGSIK